jgi:type VI secretion system secreted protein Hcp
MAQSVHLTLTNNGQQIQGESTQVADGRADTIECVYFESAMTGARDAGTGKATGKRQFSPVKLRKRVDKSSPLLAKALSQSEKLSAKFDFFRPGGDGTDQAFYTIELADAFVSDIRLIVPDTLENPGLTNVEAYEEVCFTFDAITWTYNGASPTVHTDSWSGKERK